MSTKKKIFRVTLRVGGDITMRVRADSAEDARLIAEELYNDDGDDARGIADNTVYCTGIEDSELDPCQDESDAFGCRFGSAFGDDEDDEDDK